MTPVYKTFETADGQITVHLRDDPDPPAEWKDHDEWLRDVAFLGENARTWKP